MNASGEFLVFLMKPFHFFRYDSRKMPPNPRRWKTNFRCALNALPDIEEVTEKSCTRGNNAFKVYRMKPMPRAVGFRGKNYISYNINKLYY